MVVFAGDVSRAAAVRGDRGRARLERDRSRVAAGAAARARAAPAGAGSSPRFGIGALGGAIGVILGTHRMPALCGASGSASSAPRERTSSSAFCSAWRDSRLMPARGGVDWAILLPAWPARYRAAGSARATGRSTRTCSGSPSARPGARRRAFAAQAASSWRRSRRSPWRADATSCCAGAPGRHRPAGANAVGRLGRDREHPDRREDCWRSLTNPTP